MAVALLGPTTGAPPDGAPVWPPLSGHPMARKPAGGFIDCPVDRLTLPWWCYQEGAIDLGTLRVWLGTLELVEKRCGAAPEVPAHYGPEELRRVLRLPRLAPVTAALQQLEALGLLAWSPQAIQFLPQGTAVQEALAQEGYRTVRAQLAPGLRWVPVPRRLLVWLAQDGQPGVIATACGVLPRCMRYKARQCEAAGRVAAPWIATVFGVAERTVQRAFTTLEACGWLARLAVQPEHERPHGRYTVINLAWEWPGTTGEPRDTRKAAAAPPAAPRQKMSPLQEATCQNLSPISEQTVSINTGNTEPCSPAPPCSLSQPFQEARQDPEPAGRGPTGASTREGQDEEPIPTAPPPPSEEEPVTDDEYAVATARLVAQGTDPAFLIRPVVLAEVQRVCDEAAGSPAAAPVQAPAVTTTDRATPDPDVPRPAPAACPPAPRPPQAPAAVVPACARPPTRTPPPTLREVTLADLGDVSRLLALHQQARVRGWLRGGEAERLNVVAAAVHARRVGQDPCRLFVALLRDRRWEVITQDDEDQTRALLRAQRDGPGGRVVQTEQATRPAVPLSDDARGAARPAGTAADRVARRAVPGREVARSDVDPGALGAGAGGAHAVAPTAGAGPPTGQRPGGAGGAVGARGGPRDRGGRGDGRRTLAGTTPRRIRCEMALNPITTSRGRTTAGPRSPCMAISPGWRTRCNGSSRRWRSRARSRSGSPSG